MSGICIPAGEVGGDFFDYIWLDEEKTKFGIVLADVSGKAMKAAMTAVMSSGMLYSRAGETDSIKEILTRINRPLYFKTDKSMFTAMCLASININTKELTFTNAGLNEPLLKRERKLTILKSEGLRYPLGMAEKIDYGETILQLESGDLLLFHTDGVTEAQDQNENFYGDERLQNFLSEIDSQTLSAFEIREAVINNVKQFIGDRPQFDDMTLVVVKIK